MKYFLTAFFAACSLWLYAPAFAAEPRGITLLFTHDLHARLEPDGRPGKSPSGGFARLSALAIKERAKNPGGTLLLDAGDFCSGTLFDSILAQEAPELNAMGAMGYDAVTFGNHDFEAGPGNVALELAAANNPRRPAILLSNTLLDPEKPGLTALAKAFAAWPVKKYAVFERNGLRIGIFGLMGRQASGYVQTPGISFTDPVAAASETVKALREKEKCGLVIALSHSGTASDRHGRDNSEDEELAKAVPGIDVIISGHTHSLLKTPLTAGKTLIVSSGYWGRNLGILELEKDPAGGFRAARYELRHAGAGPVDEEILGMVDRWKAKIDELYLAKYGLKYDSPVAWSFGFTPPAQVENSTEPLAMGDLAADAFRAGLKAAEGPAYKYAAAAVIPLGLIKSSLFEGEIKTPDIFRVMPIGAGVDGKAGHSVAAFHLYGADLLRLLEADATIARRNPDARLMTAGIRFSWSFSAPPFARVKEVSLEEPDGSYKPLEEGRLYRIVTSEHAALYMRLFFNPPIVPLNSEGTPLKNIKEALVLSGGPGERIALKEWVALAHFLSSFPRTGPGGLPQVPDRYRTPRPSITVLP